MRKLIIILLFFNAIYVKGQDVVFSQFYNTPLFTNSAFTGLFEERMRVGTSLRTQWYNIGNSFNTFSVFGDMRFNAFGNDYFSVGATLLNDNTGNGNLHYSYGQFSLSYSKNLHVSKYTRKSHYILLGTQAGYGNRYFGKNPFSFGSQFDKTKQEFDPNIPNGENLISGKVHFNINLGLAYYFASKSGAFYAGMNVEHINKPDISLVKDTNYKLNMKLSGVIGGDISINNYLGILPAFYINKQGAHTQFLLGSHVRYEYYIRDNNAFRVGGWLRFNNSIHSLELGSVVISSILELDNVTVGLSYDFSVSSIRQINYYHNAFELSAMYKWGQSPVDKSIHCPRF